MVECPSPDYEVYELVGTQAFMPPECFKDGKPYKPKPMDIWAVGVSIYTLMFGKLPFSISRKENSDGYATLDLK